MLNPHFINPDSMCEPSKIGRCKVCGESIKEGYSYRVIDDHTICDDAECMFDYTLKHSELMIA
ncbi:hypothetical protein G4V62_14025 [Bacillaceae bacterium SIJ1]|uniref:hypothetical protein n=1 Tax=Litoribacterium kuwaitense TaxID=1398745 RepID=UPI0013EBF5FF|nr:hypothetical protein [Litoribacterium kuwaitense]NGP46011.1 hypothetical protein [Litoribacterium kuwaitense]